MSRASEPGPLDRVGEHGGSPLRRMTPDVDGRCLVWGRVRGKSRPGRRREYSRRNRRCQSSSRPGDVVNRTPTPRSAGSVATRGARKLHGLPRLKAIVIGATFLDRRPEPMFPANPLIPGNEGDGIARKSLGPASGVVSTVKRASPASDGFSSPSPRLRRLIEAGWRRQGGSGRGRCRVLPSISASSAVEGGSLRETPSGTRLTSGPSSIVEDLAVGL
jgi:hypothetical protein